MKSQRIALIALAVAGALSSQARADNSSITLYGVLDAAVGTAQHSFSTDSQFPATVVTTLANPVGTAAPKNYNANSVNGIFNGGIQDSRWGLRGKEDLGDGLYAVFTLESGINLPTGQLNNGDGSLALSNNYSTAAANTSLDGQLFSRQSWIGLSDDTYGTLTVGRQYQPIYDILVTYDPVQFAQIFSPLGFSGGFGGGVGISEELRVDNSLKYSNKVGDFNFGALYKFGGISGHNGARSDWALRLGYEDGPLGIQLAYERITDGLIAKADTKLNTLAATGFPNTVTSAIGVNNQNSVGFLLAAKYHLYDGNIKAGYQRYTLQKASEAFGTLNITQLNGVIIDQNNVTNVINDRVFRTYFIGGDYNVLPKLNLALGFYNIQQDSAAAATGDPGQLSGTQRYYSFLADYNLSKRTDTYAGVVFQNLSGPAFQPADYSSNRILAVGVRHKF